jgi:hypothetical protein
MFFYAYVVCCMISFGFAMQSYNYFFIHASAQTNSKGITTNRKAITDLPLPIVPKITTEKEIVQGSHPRTTGGLPTVILT